jgi:vacuolar-type H+-ATPase subunit I/STV1
MVDDIRRRSEQQFREKEQALTKRLKEVESEIQKLEIAGEGGAAILSDRERSEIEKFRAEMLDTRRQLRDVKLALRRDIDRLDGWLKFANIALVPTAIGLAGLGWTYFETRRRRNTKTSDEERKSA